MTENVENLVLGYMKRFQASLDRVEYKIGDLANRMGSVESGQAAIIQHLGHFPASDAAQQLSIDHINTRLDRIERRLELAN